MAESRRNYLFVAFDSKTSTVIVTQKKQLLEPSRTDELKKFMSSFSISFSQVRLPPNTSDDVDEDPTGNKALWDRGLLNGASQKVKPSFVKPSALRGF